MVNMVNTLYLLHIRMSIVNKQYLTYGHCAIPGQAVKLFMNKQCTLPLQYTSGLEVQGEKT